MHYFLPIYIFWRDKWSGEKSKIQQFYWFDWSETQGVSDQLGHNFEKYGSGFSG